MHIKVGKRIYNPGQSLWDPQLFDGVGALRSIRFFLPYYSIILLRLREEIWTADLQANSPSRKDRLAVKTEEIFFF